ncbi:MAG: BolA family protein [Kangiellaceae bacterium]|jgi:acid stress-induced BolA-like protein IbaG/YrbA|nr:BolA family protein [Kangiellaceae bacterium]|tara:strand:- start:12007 stop:12234 length:228 start_codon:yes stop_codon:yes gene_type:complete
MTVDEVVKLIKAGIEGCEVEVVGDGSHFDATVVSEAFQGLNAVKKQQLVYSCVMAQIKDGSLHALNIRALTPDEV